MRWLKKVLVFIAIVLIVYLIGPHPSAPKYETALPGVPEEAATLEQYIVHENASHIIKTDNEARIIWNDSSRQKTEYAIVYLHGFSASQEEGDPVHKNIAAQFGCNLYLSRLAEHGIDTVDAMANLTADRLWETAKEAYSIGRQLGKKVILMGTSTGATLAIKLASVYPEISSIILLSPNIAINDPNAWLLNNPWGLQIARLVKGSKFNTSSHDFPEYKKYWFHQYRLEAAVALQEFLETSMNEKTFKAVNQPALVLYYYKDEQHQDHVVKVSAMKKMFEELGTADAKKKMIPVPEAGDHVLASPILSHDILTPQKEVAGFLSGTLQMQAKQ